MSTCPMICRLSHCICIYVQGYDLLIADYKYAGKMHQFVIFSLYDIQLLALKLKNVLF